MLHFLTSNIMHVHLSWKTFSSIALPYVFFHFSQFFCFYKFGRPILHNYRYFLPVITTVFLIFTLSQILRKAYTFLAKLKALLCLPAIQSLHVASPMNVMWRTGHRNKTWCPFISMKVSQWCKCQKSSKFQP